MAKIKEMFNLVKGSLQSSKCTPGEYNFITASKDWKTHNEFEYDCEALIFAAAASGSLGRTHYVNGKFISSDLCFIITPKNEIKYPIDLKFYHIIFNTLKEDIVKNTKAGTSKEAIGLKALGEYDLPYIDIDKQREISSKFNFATQISESFDTEITHQLDLIKNLRQAFLREAMQGILVSNETSDHKTGADLLAEIQAEKAQLVKDKKIKKPKPLAPITAEELPFAIPENWTWCRLGEITISSEAGKSYLALQDAADLNEWGVIKTSAITSGVFLENENKRLNIYLEDYLRFKINEGDLLFCRASGSKGLAGRSCIVMSNTNASLILSDKSIRFKFKDKITSQYVHLYNSSDFAEYYYNTLGTGKSTSMNNITREQFYDLTIPLPPLEIQERIVAKLDDLMGYCDALEEQVKQSQKSNELLLQQVLREALGGATPKQKNAEIVELKQVSNQYQN